MAFKLTKGEDAERDEHVEALRVKRADVEAAEQKFAENLTALVDRLNDVIREYNGTLADAKSFAEKVAERAREEYDNKSEKWQGSDKGEAASTFTEAWEEVAGGFDDLEEVEMDPPESLTLDHADTLAETPTEAEE